MRYNKYIAFLFFLLPLMLISQRYDNTWLWGIYPQQQGQLPYYGNGQGEFHTDTFISQDKPRETWFYYTNHSFSNEEGSLLFYTNGMRIKDSAALTITNGDSLNYGLLWEYCKPTELSGTPYNVWYSHFALPSPENDSLYYLFHIRGDTTPPTWKGSICYTIIKRESNGNLLVTQKNKLLSNLLPTYGGVNACRHANGRDWWIEFIQVGTNCLHKYLLTPDTIIYINSQCVGQINDWTDGVKAYFSRDGTMFVKTSTAHGTDVYSFDRCNGNVQLLQHVNSLFEVDSHGNISDFIVGSEISSNNRYLYLNMGRYVFQYDLQASDVEGSLDTVGVVDYFVDSIAAPGPYYFNFTQYAPDGKIYIGPKGGCRWMSTIDYPDSGGISCHVAVRSVPLTNLMDFTMPYFPNYRLGRLIGSACDTIYSDIKPIYKDLPWLKVYPNPATDIVRFDYNWVEWEQVGNCKLQVAGLDGKIVMEQEVPKYSTWQEINVKLLPNGVYTVSLTSGYSPVEKGDKAALHVLAVCKFVKQ